MRLVSPLASFGFASSASPPSDRDLARTRPSLTESEALSQVIELAFQRAAAHGAAHVMPKDIVEAAQLALRPGQPPESPAQVLSIHFDEICATLGDIRRDVEAVQTDGISSPRVLVIGETSGVVSSMLLCN